ncbi:hypothetical protein C8R47DRAFT_1253238 [Mycena vitilis]|nr:hypothetical protein C8R47DRAFT_1253238 [Mycena vitilis]
MPSVRRTGLVEKQYLSPGEQFCFALGLGEKLETFKECKKVFRRIADSTFDLSMPLFQQQHAMEMFTLNVVSNFPGFFDDSHENNKERITHLQHYARSYLEKSGKLTTGKKKGRKPPRPNLPPAKQVVKVERPKPKPLYGGKPMNGGVDDDVAMPDAPTPEDVRPQTPPADQSPPPFPKAPSSVAPAPTQAQDAPSRILPGLHEFLAACFPPMSHRVAAFEAAGVKERIHLLGIASWKEEGQRRFLKNNGIASTALEVEALVIGLSGLL